MIKKTIKYVDFNDNVREEDFYFNLTKDELIQLGVRYPGGLEHKIEQLITSNDSQEIYVIFRTIVLESYGEKSEDGKRFIKSKELSRDFSQTNAFSELIMELINDSAYGAKFIEGLIPKDLLEQVKMEERLNVGSDNS